MMTFVKLYAVAAVTFFAIDVVWIGVVASGFYQRHIGHLAHHPQTELARPPDPLRSTHAVRGGY